MENWLENDSDLISELKKHRGNNIDEEVTIDGTSGEAIPSTFATIYRELFNREQDDDKISQLLNRKMMIWGTITLKKLEKSIQM